MNDCGRRIVTIIQTRRESTRLPDKVLMPLAGKPLFIRQVERVQAARLAGKVVVATTPSQADDLIVDICREEGVACVRGHAADLLDRHYRAACHYEADIALKTTRLSSDEQLLANLVLTLCGAPSQRRAA